MPEEPNDFSGMQVGQPVPEEAKRAAEVEQEKEKEDPTLGEGFNAALKEEQILYWTLGQENMDLAPDPDFKWDDELTKEVTEGLPEQYHDYILEGARSAGEARELRKRAEQSFEREQTLSDMGWTGLGLRLGSAMGDPVGLGLGVATGGIGWVQKGTRMARIAKGGLATGAEGAALETALQGSKPGGDWNDVMYTATAAAGLGGGAAALLSRNMAKDIARNEIDKEGMALTEKGDKYFQPEEDSAGAARAVGVETPVRERAEEARIDAGDASYTSMGKGRFDSVGSLKSSKNPISRKWGAAMGEDAVGNKDGSKNTFAASEWQRSTHRAMESRFYQSAKTQLNDWSKEQGFNWYQKERNKKRFYEEVTDALEGSQETSAQAAKTAQNMRDMLDEYRELANNPGVKEGSQMDPIRGFGKIERDPYYAPRIFDKAKVDDTVARYGDDQLESLVNRSLREAVPEITDEVAKKVSRGYLKRVRQMAKGLDENNARALNGEDTEGLRDILVNDAGLDESDVMGILRTLDPEQYDTTKGKGATARAKKRTSLNMDTSMRLKNRKTGEFEPVTLKSLTVRDAEELFPMYSRQMSGEIAMARAGLRSESEFTSLKDDIKAQVGEIADYTNADANRDIANLDFLWKGTKGIPMEDPESFGVNVGRMLKDYNFARVMGQVGWAQLSELGNITGQLGWKTAMQSIPSLRTFTRNAVSGQLDDEVMDELEGVLGTGTDILRSNVGNRWDDFGSRAVMSTGKPIAGKLDAGLQYSKLFVANASGMNPVNTMMHRWTAKGIAQKFSGMAHGSGKISRKRMLSMGIDEKDLDRILGQLRKHSVTEKGITGHKIKAIKLDKWDDLEAASMFKSTVDRWARHIVQENDIGNMHRWMGTTVGQIIGQFRSFMMVSWAKQFLHGIHARDFQTFASFSSSMVAAGLAYTGQTYLKSIGRDDAKEYREERLSSTEIGKAAFQRSAWASLIPAAMDTGGSLVGEDPFFAYGRSTGLATGALGNPTVDLMNKIHAAGSGAGASIADGDYDYSQADLRNLTNTLMFQNIMGVQNILNASGSGLPERSSTDF